MLRALEAVEARWVGSGGGGEGEVLVNVGVGGRMIREEVREVWATVVGDKRVACTLGAALPATYQMCGP